MGGGVTIFGFFERGMLSAYPCHSMAPIYPQVVGSLWRARSLQTGYGGLSFTIRVQGVIKVRLTPISALSATARAANSY